MNEMTKPPIDMCEQPPRGGAPLPLIGVSACRRANDAHFPGHWTAERYLRAAAEAAGGMPIQIPALGGICLSEAQLHGLLERVDGLLLTGSPSNVEPHHYDGIPSVAGTLHDPDRDRTTLPLIRLAIRDGVPLLAICRGIQELNVALGGTLHQRLWEVPGRFDHRSDKSRVPLARYDAAHPVTIRGDGLLARILGRSGDVAVNSLHAQAIDRPAPALQVEATAEDGTIEAVSLKGAGAFALGLQWHAEWNCTEDPVSVAVFKAFGDACRARARTRHGAGAPAA